MRVLWQVRAEGGWDKTGFLRWKVLNDFVSVFKCDVSSGLGLFIFSLLFYRKRKV